MAETHSFKYTIKVSSYNTAVLKATNFIFMRQKKKIILIFNAHGRW